MGAHEAWGIPGNSAPTTSNSSVSTLENIAIAFQALDFPFNDDDPGDTLQAVRIATLPGVGSLTLSGNPVSALQDIAVGDIPNLVYTPPEDDSGDPLTTFTFAVIDGFNVSNSATMDIIVTPANTAPTISDIADQTTPEDTAEGPLPFTVGDAETAPGDLIVTATSDNQTLISDGNIALGGSGADRTITLTPVADENGTATITVTVSDGEFTATAGDQDLPPDDLTFSLDAAATALGMSITSGGDFSWTPSESQGGASHNATITVSDGSATDEETIQITVNDTTGPNTAPTTTEIDDVEVAEDAPSTVVDLFAAFDDAEDPDADLIYVIQSNSNTGLFTSVSIDNIAGTLTLDYAPDTTGTAQITVRATDTGSLFVETTFTVTVIGADEQINDLVDVVQELKDTGVLDNGQANPPLNFLKQAIKNLAKGKTSQAIKKLNDFIDRVQGLIDDEVLTLEQGQPLIDAAHAAITAAFPGSPLLVSEVASRGGTGSGLLTHDALQPIVQDAVDHWRAEGVDAQRLNSLTTTAIHIANLPGYYLGAASSSEIWIDQDAAGHGWFIGAVHAPASQISANKVDLLSVVTHELGHVLGFEHDESGSVMDAWLSPGERPPIYGPVNQGWPYELFSGLAMPHLFGRSTVGTHGPSGNIAANDQALMSVVDEWDYRSADRTVLEIARRWMAPDRKAEETPNEIGTRDSVFSSLDEEDQFDNDQEAIDVELDDLIHRLFG